MRPRILLALLFACLATLAIAAPVLAERFIPPGREQQVLALFAPYTLGGPVADGYRMRTESKVEHEIDTLQRALDAPYLEDGGFTDRVMARLPPPRRRGVRAALLAGGVLAGAAALVASPVATFVGDTLAELAASGSAPAPALLAAAAAVTALVGACVYAFRPA